MKQRRILLVKPPDRFLEDEFVYQQLGPHYLQSFLSQHDIASDILVLYERSDARRARVDSSKEELSLDDLDMLLLSADGKSSDIGFDSALFENYDVVAMSVMTPQAPDAYLLNNLISREYPDITTVIGGSHPRYYQKQVEALPPNVSFDFIVPQDGWNPMLQISTGSVNKGKKPTILVDSMPRLASLPPPSRPAALMEKYNFSIGGAPAYHTITALGCPFTCHFCESGIESVRTFSQQMIHDDLATMSAIHDQLGHKKSL